MTAVLSLREAVADLIHDGDTVVMEGFAQLIPHAAGHEVIRQGRKNLTLIRMTPDLMFDQMIGMGCARKLIFSWGGSPGVGSLHRFRDAVENGWPHALELDEHSHGAMASALEAGAAGLPLAVCRGYLGTDFEKVNPNIKRIECPFTGEMLAAVPSVRADVAVIHAQRADRKGNVHLAGIIGVQKEAVMASERAIVTVEEIVDDLGDIDINAVLLPQFLIDAVCEVPRGAHPSYAQGYYERHNGFYKRWDPISRDRDTFMQWMEKYILGTTDWPATWARFEEDGYV